MKLAATIDSEAARHKYLEALNHLDDAIMNYEQSRASITEVSYRTSFSEQFAYVYRNAIRCCLSLGRLTEALHYLERSRSQTLAEVVSNNLIPDRKATEVSYLKDMADYVALLPDNRSCLLEFLTWDDDERLRAFLVTKRRGLELVTFPEKSLDQLKALFYCWAPVYGASFKMTERYFEMLKSAGAPNEALERLRSLTDRKATKADIVWDTCHQLYDLIFNAEVEIVREGGGPSILAAVQSGRLLDQLNAMLEQGDVNHPRRIYVVPHSYLFLLPLHAACRNDQQQPRYLLEDYVITYAPSAYLLKVCQERQYPKPPQPRAIVVGNPQPLTDATSLGFAAEEARTVAKQLTGAGWTVDELIETKATKQRFLNGDENGVAGINRGVYSHLHLAQHAGIGNQRHQAFLIFGQPSKDAPPEQYLCESAEIAGTPLQKTGSALLAACLTSFNLSVSEYMGMSAAFLQAGVGTCIGTIYALSDAGSSRLMPKLYELHLKEGLSWADALRQAQLWMSGGLAAGASRGKTMGEAELELLEESLIPLDHPYHWAAFTLSGKA